jgi:hypothetical protein
MLTDSTHKGFDVNVTAELWAATAGGTAGSLSVLGGWPGAVAVSTKVVAGSTRATVSLPASQTLGARLWQPNGHGEQVRYNLTATFTPSTPSASSAAAPSVATRLIGFRHIAMVTVDDTDPAIVAKAPSQDGTGSLTMMFRVNGAPLYARGGNKIPMELLDGRMSAVAHRRLVQSAAEGNFNMLRIWGGAIFEPRAFYDAADEFGVLLYHDMQLTRGETSLTTPQVKSELEYQVKRLSHHPSIAMWDGCNECGGMGEFMNFVMPVVASVDSSRPIWPSCPAPGWISGVDRLSARPNGKKLLTGSGGAGQSIGEGRPKGFPFNMEGHGPYTAFMSESVLPLCCTVWLKGKIHRVDPDFGSTLTISNRGSQSKCWVNLKIMGEPCEFQVLAVRVLHIHTYKLAPCPQSNRTMHNCIETSLC